ncbi:hypothetical protein D3C84_824630 [compost metagenome]
MEARVCAVRISSCTATAETSAEFLMMSMVSLVSAGSMLRSTWGICTCSRVCSGDMPRSRAASSCPLGSIWNPERRISPWKAALLRVSASTAAANGGRLIPTAGRA